MRGWKNIFPTNGKQRKAGEAILISDKIDLKIKNIIRDKERHYIMIKGSIQEEDITIVNIYAPADGNCNHEIKRHSLDFPGDSGGKASVYNAGDLSSIPGLGRSPGEGNGNLLQYYCLENPMDRGAW